MEVKLGRMCRDKLSGITGIAMNFIELVQGTVQVTIQPQADPKTNTEPPAIAVDVQQVEGIKSSKGIDATTPHPTTIELGWKVKDVVSGLTGMVTQRMTFVNGCIYCTVVTGTDRPGPKSAEPTEFFVPQQRLEKIDDGVRARFFAPEPVAARTNGGPRGRIYRQG